MHAMALIQYMYEAQLTFISVNAFNGRVYTFNLLNGNLLIRIFIYTLLHIY